MMTENDRGGAPRICLCVLMNHPFPQNVPLLRRLYADRFSTVLFLIPFHRSDDPDILTTYRGSYNHAGYVTDVQERLKAVTCDYYVFVHDDVLLRPDLSEATFRDFFPMGPDDGYISRISAPGKSIGHWTWFMGFLAKLLYPKSQLFGSGIEAETFATYMPDREALLAKFHAAGIPVESQGCLTTDDFADVARQPSRVLLHGLAARLPHDDPAQQEVDRLSLAAELTMVEAMAADVEAHRARAGLTAGDGPPNVDLPLPMITSGYYADFYIVPQPQFAEFAHYIGIASAANLFVEIAAPTLLFHVCERLWTAEAAELDLSGFEEPADLERFREPRFMAIHPYKFSTIRTPDQQDQFIRNMAAIRDGLDYHGEPAVPGEHQVGEGLRHPFATRGWYPGEGWGRWSSASPALLQFTLAGDTPHPGLTIMLKAPVNQVRPAFTGKLRANGIDLPEPLVGRMGADTFSVRVPPELMVRGGNRIEIIADELVRPYDLEPATGDIRSIGFGLISLRFA